MLVRSSLFLAALLALVPFSVAARELVTEPGHALSPAELRSVHGGTCDAACNGGAHDDDPSPVGTSYWEVNAQTLVGFDRGVEVILHTVENLSDSPTTYTFEYADRTVRSVEFGGSFGRFFTASIGGEIDRTITRTLQKTMNPYERLVLSSWLETRRYRVEGTRYQDYDDGTRKVVGRDSGPFVSASTRTRLATYSLR